MNPESRQTLVVNYDLPVFFTDHVFDPDNRVLVDSMSRLEPWRRHRVLVLLDAGLVELTPNLALQADDYARAWQKQIEFVSTPEVWPGGENSKRGWDMVHRLTERMIEARLSRHCHVLAVGGAAFLDVVGMAAALVHRGVRLTRVPSTALAQSDAGVGVKNGINFRDLKNALGTFAPPFCVINDFQLLRGLSKHHWNDGIAEAFKVAMIKDREFFDFLCQRAPALGAGETEVQREVVGRCARLHLQHIGSSGDPFEFGNARPLDFGHWSAHKLETLSGFSISHGEAVASGIRLDSRYAYQQGWITENDLHSLLDAMRVAGLPPFSERMLERDRTGALRILGGIEEFREHLGGELCVAFPDGVGRCRNETTLDESEIESALKWIATDCRP